MGYRAAWLTTEGPLRVHSEVFFHAMEREASDDVTDVLVCGVANGGAAWALRRANPGCRVVQIDRYPLPDSMGVISVAPWDRAGIRAALGDDWFGLVLCCGDPEDAPLLWPFLVPGGKLVVEHPGPHHIRGLVEQLQDDLDGWLPNEEVMRVAVYPWLLVVEKRNPRVIPYMTVAAGEETPAVARDELVLPGTLVVTE